MAGRALTYDLYVNVTTPPDYGNGRLTCFDLDLDVLRWRDGSLTLVDEDEFEDNRVRFGYPPEVVKEATMTAAWLQEAVGENRRPLDRTGEVWRSLFGRSLIFLRSPSRAELPYRDGSVTAPTAVEPPRRPCPVWGPGPVVPRRLLQPGLPDGSGAAMVTGRWS